jgi:hypothetical protein
VHGTEVYSAGMGLKGHALERFLDIKKKKKNSDLIYDGIVSAISYGCVS